VFGNPGIVVPCPKELVAALEAEKVEALMGPVDFSRVFFGGLKDIIRTFLIVGKQKTKQDSKKDSYEKNPDGT